jgi:signal transduction histidine kinase
MSFARIKALSASLRVRFTALYLAILAVTLVIFCAILFQVFVRNHQKEFDAALYNHAVDVAHTISVDYFGDFVFNSGAIQSNEKFLPFSLGRSFMQVVSPSSQIVARSNNLGTEHLPTYAEDWEAVFQSGYAFRTLSSAELEKIKQAQPDSSYRQVTYLVRRGQPAFILQIAVPMTLFVRETGSLLIFFFIGIPTTLLLAAASGLYLSHKALQPVREIIKKAEELNPSNLSVRLPEPLSNDEIHKLTVTLNGMLGRIEKAFESHENFIADASHQLKTPLAILRGELDVFRSKTRAPYEVEAFVDSAAQELQHMSRLLDDLLLLARVDAGAGSLSVRKVRLDEVLLETVARIDVLARKKNISIRLDLDDRTAGESQNDFLVEGDSDLLLSMFRNLVDNAIKYSAADSQVEVRLINEEHTVTAQIKDYGEPIAPELAERLFQRYERGNIRMSGVSGTGLGLTIARRIAELHYGKISILQGNSPGKIFQVDMKKV